MVNKVTFVGFRGAVTSIAPPLDPSRQTFTMSLSRDDVLTKWCRNASDK